MVQNKLCLEDAALAKLENQWRQGQNTLRWWRWLASLAALASKLGEIWTGLERGGSMFSCSVMQG